MPDLSPQLQAALADRYRVERELGRGGMATVYLAQDLKHHRQVAIKVLRPEVAGALGPDRFLREIELAAKLAHPNILPLHDSGECSGPGMPGPCFYYIMPYLPGESLRDRLDREKQLPLDDAIRITREVADALGYAHAQGVIHRDIKPENILFEAGHAVVADFGIAKAISAAVAPSPATLTETGLSIGTPAYMSPEQAAGSTDLDGRTDIYSLGCVLYEMLSGEAPYSGPNPQVILARKLTEPVPRISLLRETVPASVEAALARALAKTPADRFGSAAELVAGLEAAPAPIGVLGPRRTRIALAVTAVGALVLAALGVRVWRARTAELAGPPALAVLPFTPVSPDTALIRLGRELSLTLSNTLDGVGEFHTVDPLTVLALIPEDGRPLAGGVLLETARKLGATQTLTGTLVRSGTQVRLDLTLAGGGGQPDARISLSGPIDSLATLTDTASWAIVKSVWREGYTAPPRVDELTTRSLQALKAYLEGEQLSVRGQFDSAADAYREAFAADSGFILAYVGYVRARWWGLKRVEPEITRIITRNLDRLPEREALIQRAYAAPGNYITDTLLTQATVRWPNTWQTWYYHADHLLHFGEMLGHSRDEAMQAWQRTVELNPNLFWGWQHLWVAAYPYHLDIARGALAKAESLRPGNRITGSMRLEQESWETDTIPAALLDTIEGRVRASPNPIYYASSRAQVALEVNRRTTREMPGGAPELSRANALYWATRGRWDSAISAVARFGRMDGGPDALRQSYAFAALGAWLGAVPDSVADGRRKQVEPALTRLSNNGRTEVLWFDGIRAFARKDRAGMDRARAALHQFLSSTGFGDSLGWDPDSSLAAFAVALEGRPSVAGQRMASLEWALHATNGRIAWGPTRWSIGVNRLAAARWLAAAGDTAQAIRLLRWVDNWIVPDPWPDASQLFWPLTLLERAELLAGQGNTADALSDLRVCLLQFDDPVPPLAEIRERALRTRARLEGKKE